MTRAVVTGGAGFIGSHVADRFAAAGFDVLVFDDLSTGSRDNVSDGIELTVADITDADAVRRAFEDFAPTVCCHLAAQASVTVSVTDPRRDLDVNVAGTFNVLAAAAQHGAPVVFSSTGGALYGDAAPVPTPEHTVAEPLAPYGASKLAGEAYVATWGRLHGLPNVVLRLGNVYGPRQSPHGEAGVVAIFSDRLLRGVAPVVYGDGRQTRDYIQVSDVADAFFVAANAAAPGTYNVGWGAESTVLDVLARLQDAAGARLEAEFQPLRRGELLRSALDASALRARGWTPRVELADGLKATYDWFAARC